MICLKYGLRGQNFMDDLEVDTKRDYRGHYRGDMWEYIKESKLV